METNLVYTYTGAEKYINVAKDLSRLNSKNEEITTRDGHVHGYMLEIKAIGLTPSIYAAPNTWKMRNAFRKFHAYRNIMFENAGAEDDELGRYGKTIRPLLDAGHANDGTDDLVPVTQPSDRTAYPTGWLLDGGEWTYTELATTPIYTDQVSTAEAEQNWADSFHLQICEPNVVQGSDDQKSGFYKRVGMIHSYNIDRMEVSTPDADTIVDGPSNPLAALISSGNQATGEVLDILSEQELEKPPYDLVDDGDSCQVVYAGISASSAETPVARLNVFAPAGIVRIFAGNASGLVQVRVLGKVLCKDMA